MKPQPFTIIGSMPSPSYGTLFLVGTPIGNLEDMSDRARRVLSTVDVIAAEDTRRTGRLLASVGARPRLVSFFEANEPRTIVMFESPRRVARTMGDLLVGLGDRRVVMVRELTKLHQEVLRSRLSELAETLRGRDLKGEVVLVVEGRREREPGPGDLDEAVRHAKELVRGGARKRDAAREAARSFGVPAARIYAALVEKG